MKNVNIPLEEHEHTILSDLKGDKTWHDVLISGIPGAAKRIEEQKPNPHA